MIVGRRVRVVSLPATPEARPLLRDVLEYQVLAARRARDDGPTDTDHAESEARLSWRNSMDFRTGRCVRAR